MNERRHLAFLLWVTLSLVLFTGCSKKGKLLHFNSQYRLYPPHWQKYIVFLQEGRPEYVVYDSAGYQERWIYLCQNKIYNFRLLPKEERRDAEEERYRITSEPLLGSDLEDKLSEKDRRYMQECLKRRPGG